ncbi:hypothetical protein CI102_8994 [Trichoderma harzianum]|nr:hypothetical protein CI102_8994 [Trichoderma harzianum]
MISSSIKIHLSGWFSTCVGTSTSTSTSTSTCTCTCTCCLPLSRPRTKSFQTIEASTYSAISASQALNVTASVPLRGQHH